jgi:tRNA(Ile)-lysidine synthase
LLKQAVELVGGGVLDQQQCANLLTLCRTQRGSRELRVAGGVYVYRDYDVCELRQGPRPRPQPFSQRLSLHHLPLKVSLPDGGRVVVAKGGRPRRPWRADGGVQLAANSLNGPWRLRRWRPGDRIHLPMAGKSRKLQDIFVDTRLPRTARRRALVVEHGSHVAAVLAEGSALVDKHYIVETPSAARVSIRMERASS